MKSLLELFCDVDDFCIIFLPVWEQHLLCSGQKQRQRKRSLTMSEVMTILITFHQSHYRDFKAFYQEQVLKNWRAEFPGLVSYTRFVEYIPSAFVPLTIYLRTCCLGDCTGISFIDSTSLDVCLNQRIHSHKVFAGLAERGKTSTGWFYGFKLHLVVNDRGELLQYCFSQGNVDDRKPVPHLAEKLFGKLDCWRSCHTFVHVHITLSSHRLPNIQSRDKYVKINHFNKNRLILLYLVLIICLNL